MLIIRRMDSSVQEVNTRDIAKGSRELVVVEIPIRVRVP